MKKIIFAIIMIILLISGCSKDDIKFEEVTISQEPIDKESDKNDTHNNETDTVEKEEDGLTISKMGISMSSEVYFYLEDIGDDLELKLNGEEVELNEENIKHHENFSVFRIPFTQLDTSKTFNLEITSFEDGTAQTTVAVNDIYISASNDDFNSIPQNTQHLIIYDKDDVNIDDISNNDISPLEKLSNLALISIETRALGGDINFLGNLSKLKHISIFSVTEGTHFEGDINFLTNLFELDYIDINQYTGISGDIKSLANLQKLKHISLSGEYSGDLSDLEKHSGLDYIYLCSKQVTGNLDSLSSMYYLEGLELWECNVEGDISVLNNLTGLESLSFSDTDVEGDISILSSFTNLHSLYLSNTAVGGDISNLGSLVNLYYLDISNTNIYGDISNLSELNNLNKYIFSIDNCFNLSGELLVQDELITAPVTN